MSKKMDRVLFKWSVSVPCQKEVWKETVLKKYQKQKWREGIYAQEQMGRKLHMKKPCCNLEENL